MSDQERIQGSSGRFYRIRHNSWYRKTIKMFTKTDEYFLKQFEKMCPDAYKGLNSLNPIVRKRAESTLRGFTVGFLTRNNFSDSEIVEFERAVGYYKCPNYVHAHRARGKVKDDGS